MSYFMQRLLNLESFFFIPNCTDKYIFGVFFHSYNIFISFELLFFTKASNEMKNQLKKNLKKDKDKVMKENKRNDYFRSISLSLSPPFVSRPDKLQQ